MVRAAALSPLGLVRPEALAEQEALLCGPFGCDALAAAALECRRAGKDPLVDVEVLSPIEGGVDGGGGGVSGPV